MLRKWMDLYIDRVIDPYMDFWVERGACLPWWVWLFFWPVLVPLAITGFLIVGVFIWAPLMLAPGLLVLIIVLGVL